VGNYFALVKQSKMNHYAHSRWKNIVLPDFGKVKYLVVSCSLFFMSCARYYYAPNSVNIPLLSEGEAKINVQYSTGSISDGFECQSAFAVSSHFGGMVNMMVNESSTDVYFESEATTHMSFIEAGAGYFTPIKSTDFIFETYGGIGTGGVRNEYDPGNSTVRFTKLFLQPNIGYKINHFEVGVGSRLSWTKHNVITPLPPNSEDYIELEGLKNNPVSVFWEPGIALRAGFRKFMLQLQLTKSVNLNHTKDAFTQEDANFSIGFNIPIHYKTADK